MSLPLSIHPVDPARLASGRWDHQRSRQIGEGDIAASYSADRIGLGQTIRKPFAWRGSLWVSVGSAIGLGVESVRAYRMISPDCFDGEPVIYAQKTVDADSARHDPHGFYHGMIVRRGGQSLVLCGPPVCFVPGQTQQLDLFGDP